MSFTWIVFQTQVEDLSILPEAFSAVCVCPGLVLPHTCLRRITSSNVSMSSPCFYIRRRSFSAHVLSKHRAHYRCQKCSTDQRRRKAPRNFCSVLFCSRRKSAAILVAYRVHRQCRHRPEIECRSSSDNYRHGGPPPRFESPTKVIPRSTVRDALATRQEEQKRGI